MPVERKYHLPDLVAALRQFQRRITLEYVLIAGMNDAPEDATALAELARPLGALVNLLPLHPGGAPGLVPTAPAATTPFPGLVRAGGVRVRRRRSRGLGVEACQRCLEPAESRIPREPEGSPIALPVDPRQGLRRGDPAIRTCGGSGLTGLAEHTGLAATVPRWAF